MQDLCQLVCLREVNSLINLTKYSLRSAALLRACIRARQITHSTSLEMLTHLNPSVGELLEAHPEYFWEIDNCPECVCFGEQPVQIEIYSIEQGQWLPDHNFPPLL